MRSGDLANLVKMASERCQLKVGCETSSSECYLVPLVKIRDRLQIGCSGCIRSAEDATTDIVRPGATDRAVDQGQGGIAMPPPTLPGRLPMAAFSIKITAPKVIACILFVGIIVTRSVNLTMFLDRIVFSLVVRRSKPVPKGTPGLVC